MFSRALASLALALPTLLLAACLMTPVMRFGEGKTAKQAQRDTMTEIGPSRLATGETWKGEVTTRTVRVYADGPYRTQNIHWQDTFNEALELTNIVLTPLFGVRLVADYHVWDRDVPGATLADSLDALRAHDPGDDNIFAVIGLTSSLPLVSATFDQLGYASVGGRHIMLRGYADLEERKAYANAFPDLTPEERELALVHLRHHKSAVILLHELGHNLGMDHEVAENTIMNASYSSHATAFSPTARSTMLASVDKRLNRASSTTPPSSTPTPTPTPTPVLASAPPPPHATTPSPTTDTPTMPHDPILIRVTKKAATMVNGKTLDTDALDTLLKATFAEAPKTRIIISQDRNLPPGVMGDLLDRLKAAGFAKVEFAWSGH
ncbi:MAG TPA: biopolymer transporter ExbD [Kofleriaceae bacterium]|nr:biopolymer transporter ExbD [Kofleriaceae bacterium]